MGSRLLKLALVVNHLLGVVSLNSETKITSVISVSTLSLSMTCGFRNSFSIENSLPPNIHLEKSSSFHRTLLFRNIFNRILVSGLVWRLHYRTAITPSVTISGIPTTTICPNTTVNLSATSTTSGNNYQWTNATGGVPSSTTGTPLIVQKQVAAYFRIIYRRPRMYKYSICYNKSRSTTASP